MWEDSTKALQQVERIGEEVSLRLSKISQRVNIYIYIYITFDGIYSCKISNLGPVLCQNLLDHGINSFEMLEKTESREIELVS